MSEHKFRAFFNGQPFHGTITEAAATLGGTVDPPSTIVLGKPWRSTVTFTAAWKVREIWRRCPMCNAAPGAFCHGDASESCFIQYDPARVPEAGALQHPMRGGR
jgi:hypothetical protein